MKRILIPVDGSPQSLEAVRATLRDDRGAIERIDLLNVQPLFSQHIAQFVPRTQREAWRAERALLALEPARRLVDGAGVACGVHAMAGAVAPTIVQASRRLGAEEIVIGSRRRGLFGRLITNSVSTRLLEMAGVPVRVILTAKVPFYERLAVPAGLGLGMALYFIAEE